MSSDERAVCARLRRFRESSGFSQVGFAAHVGMSVGLVSSYENAQSQLNYPAAWKVFQGCPKLNPEWLAGDKMQPMLTVPAIDYPAPDETGYGQRASFLTVFRAKVKQRILAARSGWGIGANDPWPYFCFSATAAGKKFALVGWGEVMQRWLDRVPDARLNDFLNALMHDGEGILRTLIEGKGGQISLTTPGVAWLQLKQDVGAELKRRGMTQAALARTLGVSRQIVNSWLRVDGPEPAADAALRMLAWVLRRH